MSERTVPAEDVYCTSFCNQGHRLSNGHPVNHECYVLKTDALRLEREGKVEDALKTGVRTDRILSPRPVTVVSQEDKAA